MSLFKNKSNKNIRINSRVYIEPGQVMELDDNDRNVQMYVAIKYLSVEKNVPAPAPVAPVVAKDPTPVPEAAPVIVVEEAPVAMVEDVVPVIEEEHAPMVIEESVVAPEPVIEEAVTESDETPVVVVEEPKFKRNKKKNNE